MISNSDFMNSIALTCLQNYSHGKFRHRNIVEPLQYSPTNFVPDNLDPCVPSES